MKFGRSLRWPNLLEQIVIQIVVAAVFWTVSILWRHVTSWSERALLIIAATAALVLLAVIYERFRAEGMTVAPSAKEYEDILTDLAAKHRGTISWVTKTSIWADVPEAYSGRLDQKVSGLKSGRISRMRYIIHLGYWRTYAAGELAKGRTGALDQYRAKIQTLLRHTQDYSLCPPSRVQIVVGEIQEPGPPHRFGLYQTRDRSTLVFGFDSETGAETMPRLIIKGRNELTKYFDNLFNQQWQIYVNKAMNDVAFSAWPTFSDVLRHALVNSLRNELQWIASLVGEGSLQLIPSVPLDQAKTCLDEGLTVTLSCPQKVCISGDYGDMHDGGLTLTASVSVRPSITIRKAAGARSVVLVAGQGRNRKLAAAWPLLEVFQRGLNGLTDVYEIEVHPTQLIGVGLGSSGAASVMLAAALAILENRSASIGNLILEAHDFETRLASCPCGPQDHFASVLGNLNLVEYPSLQYRRIENVAGWRGLSFWMTKERRNARDVIPAIVRGHTPLVWSMKRDITRDLADALSRGDLDRVVEGLRAEAAIQKQLNMLTELQLQAIDAVVQHRGGAKASGAGRGGVLVVAAPDESSMAEIKAALEALGLESLSLDLDSHGITIDASGRRLY